MVDMDWHLIRLLAGFGISCAIAGFGIGCWLGHFTFKERVMSKVYLVLGGSDYEGRDVIAVMGSKEDAESIAQKARDTKNYDSVVINEWDIGEVMILV